MTNTDTSAEAVERLHERLGGVTVPAQMHGDNLAILLCSVFEEEEGEVDESGWTEAAIVGQEAVLGAIRAHYDPTLRALAARLAAAEAEVARLRGGLEHYACRCESVYVDCDGGDLPDCGWKARAALAQKGEAHE